VLSSSVRSISSSVMSGSSAFSTRSCEECQNRESFGEGCYSGREQVPRRDAAVLRKAMQLQPTPFPRHKQER
jgi:hypothetical protein